MEIHPDPNARGLVALAPAKLNLFLEIAGRRPDGYHELQTLMIRTDLHDRLTFIADDSGRIALECDDPTLPTGTENLVVRAAELLRREAGSEGERLGARIGLEKAVPAQAGLGGGSSDAAATLRCLDRLWDLHTNPGRLLELAGMIGSDVAFFLDGPAAVCRGRGEVVEPVPIESGRGVYHAVLICPPMGVRTAEVYAGLTPPVSPVPIDSAVAAFQSGDPERLGRCLFNRLQPVAERIVPALGRVREALIDLGPSLDGYLMSGSGSAYFGLARDRGAAEAAAGQLDTLGIGMIRAVRCGL